MRQNGFPTNDGSIKVTKTDFVSIQNSIDKSLKSHVFLKFMVTFTVKTKVVVGKVNDFIPGLWS